MNYLFKDKKVCIAFDKKSGDLLIMTENGEEILDLYKRSQLDWAQKAGMGFSGFRSMGFDKQGKEKFRLVELYFAYL